MSNQMSYDECLHSIHIQKIEKKQKELSKYQKHLDNVNNLLNSSEDEYINCHALTQYVFLKAKLPNFFKYSLVFLYTIILFISIYIAVHYSSLNLNDELLSGFVFSIYLQLLALFFIISFEFLKYLFVSSQFKVIILKDKKVYFVSRYFLLRYKRLFEKEVRNISSSISSLKQKADV